VNGLSLIIIPRRVFSQRSEPALTTCCQVLPQKKKAKPLLACLIPFPKKESNGRLPMGEDFDLKENSIQSWYHRLLYFGHLISLFARASSSDGRPICFAALRLITSSNCVGCSTERSAGLAPFRICPCKWQRGATRREGEHHKPSGLAHTLAARTLLAPGFFTARSTICVRCVLRTELVSTRIASARPLVSS